LPILLREGNEQRANQAPTVAAVAPGGEALAGPLDSTPSATTVPATADQPAASTSAPTDADTTTTEDAANYLVGSPTTPDSVQSITVAVPAPQPETSETATASYRRWAAGSSWAANPCAAWFLKVGTTVNVTNLDNGHSVTCTIVDRTGTDKSHVIVLDTDLFAQLADLVHAPIPVRISWK
jgi:hypothetical protein